MMSEGELKYSNRNHKEKLRRLEEWSKGNPQPPFKFSIIPTNRCNLKCDACPNSVARSKGRFSRKNEISQKKWMEIVDKGLDMGVKEWRILGGGEPLVRKETSLSILYKVKKESVMQDTEIITNGTLLEAEDIQNLVKVRTNRILFSIDGPDAKTHDIIRGVPGAFRKAFRSLRYFKKVKDKTNIDKPVIQINTVLNNKNYDRILEMMELFNRYGAAEWALHPMREYEEIKDQMQYLKLNKDQKRALKRQIAIAEDKGDEIEMDVNLEMISESDYFEGIEEGSENNTEDEKQDKPNKNQFVDSNCFEPFYGILITPKGLVGQCAPFGQGITDLDLKKRGLEEIWYGDHLQKIRRKMLNHDLTESCKKCGLLDMTEELRRELKKYRGLN